MLLTLLQPVVLGAALRAQGAVTCPEPMQVAADLQKILDISTECAPKLHADSSRDGAWLDLTLTDADGTSLGERRIDANEDCALLSHTVAVGLGDLGLGRAPGILGRAAARAIPNGGPCAGASRACDAWRARSDAPANPRPAAIQAPETKVIRASGSTTFPTSPDPSSFGHASKSSFRPRPQTSHA